jgi:hypothetical protein
MAANPNGGEGHDASDGIGCSLWLVLVAFLCALVGRRPRE